MTRYAANTDVSSDRSRAEVERTLARYGAASFMYGWDAGRSVVGFIANGRQIRIELPMPDRNSREFTHTPTRGNQRSDAEAERAYEQAVKQRWRALALVIKAKLEAVEAGISSFEDEFLAHTALPNGVLVADWLQPQITEAYESGSMPSLLPSTTPALEASR